MVSAWSHRVFYLPAPALFQSKAKHHIECTVWDWETYVKSSSASWVRRTDLAALWFRFSVLGGSASGGVCWVGSAWLGAKSLELS